MIEARSRSTRIAGWVRGHPWALLYAICVAMGIWLRSRRMFVDVVPLWGDEALSAIELMRARLLEPSVRPLGFMASSLLFARTFGASEVVLRFLPWLCGVATSVLAVPLAGRLFAAPAIRLLFVAIIAFHPYAIDYSKEFKPYSVSLFFHVCCLLAVTKYWETLSIRWLATTAALAIFGVLFAQDILFAYPAIYLALGLAAWRSRRAHLIPVAGAVVLNLGLLLLLYWLFWRHMSGPQDAGTQKAFGYAHVWWSRRYDLFYAASPDESQLAWFSRKYAELSAFPGVRRLVWEARGPITQAWADALQRIDVWVWVALHGLAFVRIASQRKRWALGLLFLPLLVVAAFNFRQLWPFGPFRANLFALLYTAALACVALDSSGATSRRSWGRLLPVLLLVIAPLLVFERVWGSTKNTSAGSEIVRAIQALPGLQGSKLPDEPELLVLDGLLCDPWRYYRTIHPNYEALFEELGKRFQARCVRGYRQWPVTYANDVLRGSTERFWILTAFPDMVRKLQKGAPRGYRILEQQSFGDSEALVVALERTAKQGNKRPRR